MPLNTRGRGVAVIAVAALLAAGAYALVRYAPPPEHAQVGQRTPDYRLARAATGDSIGLRTAYAGHVTLINIWATWCGPCREEMPSMERLYQAYRDRGFRVAAVSIDTDGPAAVLAFARGLGITFDVLHDRSTDIQQAYQTIGVPESFLVDSRGRIVYIALGAEMWDSPVNRQRIEHLLQRAD
jgi:cytochrome c biogenesis protein CcmG/thiol:disulfide interchange protein DsbE